MAETMTTIGKSFIGKPYVAHTLEMNSEEQLVVNLRQFDCWTFVEQTLALAYCKQNNITNYESFKRQLQLLRYRKGQIKGYASRIHYFTEWLFQNQDQYLSIITNQLAGKPYKKYISYITAHRNQYPKLKTDDDLFAVSKSEIVLNHVPWTYIPKAEISTIEPQLQEGDIIGITTNIEGLDISHEGFATVVNDRIHFLHASQDLKKVVVSKEPLANYLMKHPAQTGIMVARISKPK